MWKNNNNTELLSGLPPKNVFIGYNLNNFLMDRMF